VNDPGVRRASLASEPISWTTHTDWFKKFLSHPGKHLFIAELNGLPVGQIRFEPIDNRLRLSYAVDPLFRGRGIGREIVEIGVREIRRIAPNPILAEVRAENQASLRVFRALGFEEEVVSARGVYTFLLY
jgi:ribosomal protein S18 acetylase RimI-like enzyme